MNNEKNLREWNDGEPEEKRDPAAGANFIRNRFSLFRRLTLLLGLLCVFTSFPLFRSLYSNMYSRATPFEKQSDPIKSSKQQAFDVSKEITARPHTAAEQWTEIKSNNKNVNI